jgi:hypothetical protein
MRIFVICSVRDASEEYRQALESYSKALEGFGHRVYLPHRDTDQTRSGLDICFANLEAIRESDRIDIFYSSKSQGTHFDMGVAFALGKKIKVINSENYGAGKSYPRMLDEWEKNQ